MKTWRDADIEKHLTDLRWPPVDNAERRQTFLNTYRWRAAARLTQRVHARRLMLGWTAACCIVLLVTSIVTVSTLNTMQVIAERILVPASTVAGPLPHPEQGGNGSGEGTGAGGTTQGWRLPVAVQAGTTTPLLSHLLADRVHHTATVAKDGFTLLVDTLSGQILGVTSSRISNRTDFDTVPSSSPIAVSQVLPALVSNTFFHRIDGKVISVTPIPTYIDKNSIVKPAIAAVLVSGTGGWQFTFVVDAAGSKFLGVSWSTHVTSVVLSSWRGAYIIGK